MSQVIVIFRKDRTGWKEPFALFPELPADNYGNYCDSYQHVGQHCAADYHGCIANSDPASPLMNTATCSRNWKDAATTFS